MMIRNNVIHGNSGEGIQVHASEEYTVRDNVIYGNRAYVQKRGVPLCMYNVVLLLVWAALLLIVKMIWL